jgi:hypothetical protein
VIVGGAFESVLDLGGVTLTGPRPSRVRGTSTNTVRTLGRVADPSMTPDRQVRRQRARRAHRAWPRRRGRARRELSGGPDVPRLITETVMLPATCSRYRSRWQLRGRATSGTMSPRRSSRMAREIVAAVCRRPLSYDGTIPEQEHDGFVATSRAMTALRPRARPRLPDDRRRLVHRGRQYHCCRQPRVRLRDGLKLATYGDVTILATARSAPSRRSSSR